MIRLSDFTAIDFTTEFGLDPIQNKIHLYQQNNGSVNSTQLFLDDNYINKVDTRKYGVCSFYNNVMLGTPNFYFEQGLGIPNYHENSSLQVLLNKQNLPLLEFKKCKLYFAQGVLGDSSIVGHWLKIYTTTSNGNVFVLSNFIDLKTDSNAVATPPKYFENQVYNECVDFDIIDLDYLVNSNISEVNEIRDFIFGSDKPSTYHIEYGVITENSLDYFNENGYLFDKISPTNLNLQALSIGENTDGLNASLKLDGDGYYLRANLFHNRYSIEPYMNGLKNDLETYEIQYQFQMDSYIGENLINTDFVTLTTYDFEPVDFRPILKNDCEYVDVNLLIRVKNQNTSMVIRRTAQILITDEYVTNFYPQPNIHLSLHSTPINKVVNRQINKIVQSSETPKIVQIEKRIYVQSNELEQLDVLDSVFVTKLNLREDITSFKKLHLKIGELIFENLIDGEPTFEISENAYSQQTNKYILLDENYKAISVGKINKI